MANFGHFPCNNANAVMLRAQCYPEGVLPDLFDADRSPA